jgi:hypothetical protein
VHAGKEKFIWDDVKNKMKEKITLNPGMKLIDLLDIPIQFQNQE